MNYLQGFDETKKSGLSFGAKSVGTDSDEQ